MKDDIKRRALWIIGIVTACVLIFLAVQNIGTVASAAAWCVNLISPLVVGLAIALVINVPMSFVEKYLWPKTGKKLLAKIRRPVAYAISVVVILGIITGIILLVIPELVKAITVIIKSITSYVNELTEMERAEIEALPLGNLLLGIDWDSILVEAQKWLTEHSGSILNIAVGTITTLFNGVVNTFISLVFSIYIVFKKEMLKSQVCRFVRVWLPEKFGNWSIHAASVANKNFRNFVSGQSLEALILGLLCILGMWLLRLPYAPMVGVLVGVTALIPVVGAFIGAGIGAFMILTESPVKALIFIVFIIVLQQIEGNLIYPKVMGSRVNLSGMWVLAAVTVGGGIAGPIGMLISVPVASTTYALLKEATAKREQSKRQEKTSSECEIEEKSE